MTPLLFNLAVSDLPPRELGTVVRTMLALERAGLREITAHVVTRIVGPAARRDRLITPAEHLQPYAALLLAELESLARQAISIDEKRARAWWAIHACGF